MSKVLNEDIQQFVDDFELWEKLKGKKFLITGATGLIGSVLIRCLLELSRKKQLHVKIIAVIRNLEKAYSLLDNEYSDLEFLQLDLLDLDETVLPKDIDFVIHLASPTNGKYMESNPVETFNLAFESTNRLLKYVKNIGCESFVYVSSLEYYGQMFDDKPITEEIQGYIDMQSSRSSYPLGKRAAEFLCFAYTAEYGVPSKIARLTQTFGAGIARDENRVFAQFVRSIIKGEDIVLHTQGESSKPYCYTTDCISALLYILLKGENGLAYNVANENTYISIRNLADFLKENFNSKINVRIEHNNNMGYAPVTMLQLRSDKLRDLGWRPRYNLKEMFERLIDYLKE